tara:strand:- start:11659 stop:13185 length:1527 start_codon:yes stop_codon:yes gene_type:complete
MEHSFHYLIRAVGLPLSESLPNPLIKSVTCDSRKVKKGSLFLGIPGENYDGGNFWQEAFSLGAVAAVIGSTAAKLYPPNTDDAIVIIDENVEKWFGELLSVFWGNPSSDLCLIGVTGTNGKTTTTHLIEYLSSALGKQTALLGTLVNRWPMHEEVATHTTSSPEVLQETLSKVVKENVQIAAMEVSSHSLSQYRVAGCRFTGLVFTNLTQDHLDYHGSMEEYFEAKKLLFKQNYYKNLDMNPIVNVDNKWGALLAKQLDDRCWKCSLDNQVIETENVELYIKHIELISEGIKGHLYSPAGNGVFVSSLIGRFNLMNLLQAIGVLVQQKLPLQKILDAVRDFPGVPGRMERITFSKVGDIQQMPTVVVDYAHTPDALRQVLVGIRPFCSGKIICVFGCGGDRDRSKRAKMGSIVSELADLIIVTSDNPRNENPINIINDILKGIPDEIDVRVEVDRSKAIDFAISLASPVDLVLLAGKGHENYQIIGDEKKIFDDRDYARNALEIKANG